MNWLSLEKAISFCSLCVEKPHELINEMNYVPLEQAEEMIDEHMKTYVKGQCFEAIIAMVDYIEQRHNGTQPRNIDYVVS